MTIDPRNLSRDDRILAAAVRLSVQHGYRNITRQQLADEAGVSPTSVSNFQRSQITNGDHPPRKRGVMYDVRDALMQRAVDTGNLTVLAQGLADRHPAALAAPEQLRIAALTSVG